jgi:hypothetical protein
MEQFALIRRDFNFNPKTRNFGAVIIATLFRASTVFYYLHIMTSTGPRMATTGVLLRYIQLS